MAALQPGSQQSSRRTGSTPAPNVRRADTNYNINITIPTSPQDDSALEKKAATQPNALAKEELTLSPNTRKHLGADPSVMTAAEKRMRREKSNKLIQDLVNMGQLEAAVALARQQQKQNEADLQKRDLNDDDKDVAALDNLLLQIDEASDMGDGGDDEKALSAIGSDGKPLSAAGGNTVEKKKSKEPVKSDKADWIAISFKFAQYTMAGSAMFFLIDRTSIPTAWRPPVLLMGLVCMIAFLNYCYMSMVWINDNLLLASIRYMDWFFTVPLQVCEFWLTVQIADKDLDIWILYRILFATLVMLFFGYIGESGHGGRDLFAINFGKTAGSLETPKAKFGLGSSMILRLVCFVVSMVAWSYVLFEAYFGELAQAAGQDLCIGGCPSRSDDGDRSVAVAYNSMRAIITVGWAIYPAGFVINSIYDNTDEITNVIYNVADMINKCLYGVMIYIAARGAYWSNDVCHAEMGFSQSRMLSMGNMEL